MHIVVCIKQVPDTADVKIDPKTNTLIREGVASIINPFDMYAIEEGIRIKEKKGGKVTVLSMGPPQAENALREAVSLGVDNAVLLSDRAFAGSDTWASSYTLSMALKKIGENTPFSLIICGKQASDGDTAQVGPGMAAHLDIPQITYVRKIEEIGDDYLVAERLLEDGTEVIRAPFPCLLTVVKEINEPRIPSLKGKLAAKKAQVTTWKSADIACEPASIGLDGSPTKVVKIFSPPPRSGGEILKGEPDEMVKQLVVKLKDAVVAASAG
ncbi:electron transfer flavoprotein subunit beta/FixA family protein [Verrucomicrobiota bacterium]